MLLRLALPAVKICYVYDVMTKATAAFGGFWIHHHYPLTAGTPREKTPERSGQWLGQSAYLPPYSRF